MNRCLRASCSLIVILGLALSVAGEFPVTVVDDRGEEITISGRPERIVAVSALYAQIVLDLGAVDRLVAVGETPDNPLEVLALPTVGPSFAASVEVILAQEPDLVLGATDYGGERPALEAAGVTVLSTPLLASVNDILEAVHAIGQAIDAEPEAAVLVGCIASEIVTAEAEVLGLPATRAAFLYAAMPDDPYGAGAGTIENEIILRAGGENVFADVDGFLPVAIEAILERDPDVIFTAPAHVETISDHPLFQGVSAVRHGRIVGIRASVVASTGVAGALRAMIEALHDLEL